MEETICCSRCKMKLNNSLQDFIRREINTKEEKIRKEIQKKAQSEVALEREKTKTLKQTLISEKLKHQKDMEEKDKEIAELGEKLTAARKKIKQLSPPEKPYSFEDFINRL